MAVSSAELKGTLIIIMEVNTVIAAVADRSRTDIMSAATIATSSITGTSTLHMESVGSFLNEFFKKPLIFTAFFTPQTSALPSSSSPASSCAYSSSIVNAAFFSSIFAIISKLLRALDIFIYSASTVKNNASKADAVNS